MLTFTEFIEIEKITIDLDIFDIIYNIIINKEWIYLTKEMVVNWMGYSDSKDTMNDLYKKLTKKYEENIDFKEVDQNDELVVKFRLENQSNMAYGNRAKFYLVTKKTLIILLMRSKASLSGRILEHFYYIYDLTFRYYEYQIIQLKLAIEDEHSKVREMEHNKQHTIEQADKYEKIDDSCGVVYFINEKDDQNYVKIGYTRGDVHMRLQQLQTGNRKQLNLHDFIKCEDPCKLETEVHANFKSQRIFNEWFNIDIADIDAYIIQYKINNICL
jgi:hypothetical protein